jgi:uncharacterized protein YycO
MENKKRVLTLVMATLMIMILLGSFSIIPFTEATRIPEDPYYLIKKGDIVQGHWDAEKKVWWNFHYWSHTMMATGDVADGDDSYIDSMTDVGVKYYESGESGLVNRISTSDNWAILRVEGVTESIIDNVISFARGKEGHPFDFFSIIFPGLKQVEGPWPFPGYRYYCTELVWASYKKKAGINIDDDQQRWINPLEVYWSTKVDRIYTKYLDEVPPIQH